MSWSQCMEDKIVEKFGADAAICAKGITDGNLGEIAACIAKLAVDDDPVAIAADLGLWSAECVF